MLQSTYPISYHQFSPGRWESLQGSAIVERTVSLTVNNSVWLSFMCTPVDLEAMSVGFLFNEGFIDTISDIADVRLCANGDNVDIWTHKKLEMPKSWRRTSGCTGGATSVENEQSTNQENPVLKEKFGKLTQKHVSNGNGIENGHITPRQLSSLISRLFDGQTLYREAGGVHSSAISDGQTIIVSAEDIGRHNTLDKIAGRCLMENIHIPNGLILSTGRISSEMLQKAARLDAAMVVSRTAPSSFAIQMANTLGITLIGYARRERFNVYTHPGRIILPSPNLIQNRKIVHEE